MNYIELSNLYILFCPISALLRRYQSNRDTILVDDNELNQYISQRPLQTPFRNKIDVLQNNSPYSFRRVRLSEPSCQLTVEEMVAGITGLPHECDPDGTLCKSFGEKNAWCTLHKCMGCQLGCDDSPEEGDLR